jgi:hypothetical protein
LIDTLRRRDWLGIGIELAVVTLGVLLAFQIDQWGDRRKQAQEERQLLGRLYFEYQRAIDELKNVNDESSRGVMSNIRAAFGARRNPAMLREFSERDWFGCEAGYLRTAPFNDTAFQELISSGRLNLIADSSLRDQIRDLATAQALLKDWGTLGTEAARAQSPYLHRYYRYELTPDGRAHCHVRWAELFQDDSAVTALVRQYRMHELLRGDRSEVIHMTQQVRGAIACKMGKPECRR